MSTLTRPFAVSAALQAELERAYAAPPRAYHSFHHVTEVLGHADAVLAGPGFTRPAETYAAILFHDAVYVPGAKDNEARSADLAVARLPAFLPDLDLDLARVRELILLTARHGQLDGSGLDTDARHFLDCDLAILGAAPAAFDAYDAAIREEYRGHVNPALYALGRRRFLSKLLASPRLFLSDFFHARLDAPARDNLRRALRFL